MTSVARWVAVVIYRRFRWIALGAAVRSLTRHRRQRSVDAATDDLSRRLPPSVVSLAEAAPGDVLRHGGRAVAAGRQVRRVGAATRSVGDGTRRVRDRGRRVRATADRLGVTRRRLVTGTGPASSARRWIALGGRPRPEQIRHALTDGVASLRESLADETAHDERQLRSDYHRAMGDNRAADEHLLDRRPAPSTDPLPEVPPPVPPGRRRHHPEPPSAGSRVQRTYRRPVKPWDRRRA